MSKKKKQQKNPQNFLLPLDASFCSSNHQKLLPENEQEGAQKKALRVLTSAAWSAFCCTVWNQTGFSALQALQKGRGEKGERGEGRGDDGTGVEFTHPAGRALCWRDESLVLLWKTWGMLVIYNLDEGKCVRMFLSLEYCLKIKWKKLSMPKYRSKIMWITRICNNVREGGNVASSGCDYLMP